jgi:hypothetical protein
MVTRLLSIHLNGKLKRRPKGLMLKKPKLMLRSMSLMTRMLLVTLKTVLLERRLLPNRGRENARQMRGQGKRRLPPRKEQKRVLQSLRRNGQLTERVRKMVSNLKRWSNLKMRVEMATKMTKQVLASMLLLLRRRPNVMKKMVTVCFLQCSFLGFLTSCQSRSHLQRSGSSKGTRVEAPLTKGISE